MNSGFPEYTDSFLAGQDILYTQFNTINFYVEDTDQEHFYFNILKRIFPNFDFNKIFPLNGKTNVITEARLSLGNKSKVYIVDLDFDEILGIKENYDNLFYLTRYSIENYLCNKNSIYEVIREKKPNLKNDEIDLQFDFNEHKKQWKELLSDLSSTCIIIQKYSLGKEYFVLNPHRDFDFSETKPKIKNNFIPDYLRDVESLLKSIDHRYTLKAQIRALKPYYRSTNIAIANIPGKYICNLLKYQLGRLKLIYQVNLKSFFYKLSKDCCVSELEFLKNEIEAYIGT